MPASSASIPMPRRGRAEEHRMDAGRAASVRASACAARCVRRAPRVVAHERAQDRLVVLGEDLGQRRARRAALDVPRPASRTGHRDDARRQPPGHRREDRVGIGAGPVDLVDEDQRRDVEPLEGAEQERRLRLDALDRRDDEDRAVEHAEDALDLRDEVGVARGVDEVDREVADEERGDRGPDRDAAFALEVERVGLGGAGVDAADVVDGAGGEEESLGEGCLTGVDVREDSEIERAHGASCRARRCVTFWLDMGAPISLLSWTSGAAARLDCRTPVNGSCVGSPSFPGYWRRRRGPRARTAAAAIAPASPA